MPSDIGAAGILVLLIAGLEHGTALRHDGLEIESFDEVVRVTSRDARPMKLVFTDPPVRLELNGIALEATTLDLSGRQLTTFDLSGA
jgi:hypothetical protein